MFLISTVINPCNVISGKNTLSICGPLKPDGMPLLFSLRHIFVRNFSIGSSKRMSRRRRTSFTTPSLQNMTPCGEDLSQGVAVRREVTRELGHGKFPHDSDGLWPLHWDKRTSACKLCFIFTLYSEVGRTWCNAEKVGLHPHVTSTVPSRSCWSPWRSPLPAPKASPPS